MGLKVPKRRVSWRPAYRIIPNLYPRRNLYDRIAPAEDHEAIREVEDLTNSRVRQERGELALVAPFHDVSGPGSAFVMAPFTQLHPEGSRFCDGTFGAYYATQSLDTAIYETVHHTERFLRDSSMPATWRGMLVLKANIKGDFHDLQTVPRRRLRPYYHRTDYTKSQQFGRALRDAGSNGLVYHSVRHQGGRCVAVFNPQKISSCRQDRYLVFVWNGEKVTDVHRVVEHPLKSL